MTKRRKVYVNEYQGHLSVMHRTMSEAKRGRGTVPRARSIAFIEAQRGDVVLSRLQRVDMAARLEHWLREMKMENDDEHEVRSWPCTTRTMRCRSTWDGEEMTLRVTECEVEST